MNLGEEPATITYFGAIYWYTCSLAVISNTKQLHSWRLTVITTVAFLEANSYHSNCMLTVQPPSRV